MLPGMRVAVDGVNGIAGCGSVQVGTWHQRSFMCVCGNLHRHYTEEQDRFTVKVFHNVVRVAMPISLAAGSLWPVLQNVQYGAELML